MEFPIRVLIVLVLCLVAALVIMMLIFVFTGQTEDLMGGLFNFFSGLLGLGGS